MPHAELIFLNLKCRNLDYINVLKTHDCFWGRKGTKYLSAIVDYGTLRLALDKFAAIRNWPLQKTQKHIKSFVYFCPYYTYCIHHYSDWAAALSDLCHKSVLGNVVHTKVSKADVEFLKARMIFALVFLIPKSDNEAECVVAIDTSKLGIVGVLLQYDASRYLRSCIYLAGISTDC